VHRDEKRLVVPEQAAHRATTLHFKSADEVDRADPVRPTVDEITHQPQDCVTAGPPVSSVEQPGVAEERRQRVPVAVDVAHGEERCRH
jgi:hypothetical protein